MQLRKKRKFLHFLELVMATKKEKNNVSIQVYISVNIKGWNFIWSPHEQLKVKLFLWKTFLFVLPTAKNINKRFFTDYFQYYHCGFTMEDDDVHILFYFTFAKEVWSQSIF